MVACLGVVGVAYEVSVSLAGGQALLAFEAHDDLEALADQFALDYELSGGEGCVGRECVVTMLVTAMRQEMGQCAGSAGKGCVTRTSVSGAIYRKQGAAEVEAQLEAEARARGVAEVLGVRSDATPRRVPAPCVPPYCEIDCATSSEAGESALAADFIARDDELRTLMRSWPSPRSCPQGRLYPIFIGIPKSEVVGCVPRKYFGFRGGVKEPGVGAYRFSAHEEREYKRGYNEAYFGLTKKKAGWDCMRHYEILANGAVPYFEDDLSACPRLTLAHWPKQLLESLKTLPGVQGHNATVDAPLLDGSGTYAAAAAALLKFARARLTSEALATYVLDATGHAKSKDVLILSSHPAPDFMREMLIHGFRSLLGASAVDFIKPAHLYRPPPGSEEAPRDSTAQVSLYGYGFTYANRLEDDPKVDRALISDRIRRKAFDLIIYASVHRGLPFFDDVRATYSPNDVAFVDGEDEHGWSDFSAGLPQMGHYFMRELPDGCPPNEVPEGEFWL